MILLDSGPLIALLDENDSLNRRARRELKSVRDDLYTCAPVLTEVAFALPGRHHRRRLRDFLTRFKVRPAEILRGDLLWAEVLDWFDRYGVHDPDWADGCLAVLSQHEHRFRVWTFDSEFRDIWRRPDGSSIPLFGRNK
jgi:predicted nucleic acid-binding protein